VANSTTNLDLISAAQGGKEITANEMLDALSPPSLFGRRATTSIGLQWGFYGGTIRQHGIESQIANGTLPNLAPNRTIQVQAGLVLPTGFAISAITRANPCVLTTAVAHDFQVGDTVFIDAPGGIAELSRAFARVTARTATTITLAMDTATGFTAYTSGGTVRRLGDTAGAVMQLGRGYHTAGQFVATLPLYTIVTGAASVTSYTDWRAAHVAGGVLSRSVAGSADVVLTLAEAANLLITLTGAITGPIAVVLPPRAGHWWLANSTTGAHALTVRTPAGSGVVVPSGRALPVTSDGTNLLAALTALPATVTLGEGADLVLGTATGTRLGTAVTQRLGLWGATPVVQPAEAAQGPVTLGNTDNAIGGLVISAPPTQAEVVALRNACETLADDVRAMSTLLHALRSAGLMAGVWKGAA